MADILSNSELFFETVFRSVFGGRFVARAYGKPSKVWEA